MKCQHCKDKKVVAILGGGGDYEYWPCPVCCKEEFHKELRDSYSPGCYDGEGE